MTPILPHKALDSHTAVLGKTGSGKTFAIKGAVEWLIEHGRRVCIIDPTGAWWGLRFGVDGRSPGLKVLILGGEHGDMPLPVRGGEAVARLVVEQGVSVVIDTSGMGVGERGLWFTEFATALFRLNRDPLHLVIDEAHLFAPQGKVPDPQTGKMLHAANTLMSGGRSRGIRGVLITQRPQKLHKDALTCADALVAMRVMHPLDRQAVKDWIDGCGDPKQGKEVLDSLANLEKGEGWVWWPEGKVLTRGRFPAIRTFDSSATPTGSSKHHAPKNGAEVDLGEIRKALAEAAAEAEANDPKRLRAEVARLTGELKKASKAAVVPAVVAPASAKQTQAIRDLKATCSALRRALEEAMKFIVNIRVRDFKTGDEEAMKAAVTAAAESAIKRIETLAKSRVESLDRLRDEATRISAKIEQMVKLPDSTEVEVQVSKAEPFRVSNPPARRAVAVAQRTPNSGEGASTLAKGERAVLIAIAQNPEGASREQVTLLTGYKRSTRDAYIQRLGQAGHVEVRGDAVFATDAGVAALGDDYEPLPTGAALLEWWMGRLPEGERKVLACLADAYPGVLEREQISQVTGYKRSTRDAYIQRLGVRKLVEVLPDGVCMAEGLD